METMRIVWYLVLYW